MFFDSLAILFILYWADYHDFYSILGGTHRTSAGTTYFVLVDRGDFSLSTSPPRREFFKSRPSSSRCEVSC